MASLGHEGGHLRGPTQEVAPLGKTLGKTTKSLKGANSDMDQGDGVTKQAPTALDDQHPSDLFVTEDL